MPSKFGDFRFLGSKTGKTMRVNAQGQSKPQGANGWAKATASFSVGNTSVGNPRGLVVRARDTDPTNPATTWQSQDWADADQKRVVVRVQELNSTNQVVSDMGYILTPNPPMGVPAIGASLSVYSTPPKAHVMKSASEVTVAMVASGPWNQEDYKFIE